MFSSVHAESESEIMMVIHQIFFKIHGKNHWTVKYVIVTYIYFEVTLRAIRKIVKGYLKELCLYIE